MFCNTKHAFVCVIIRSCRVNIWSSLIETFSRLCVYFNVQIHIKIKINRLMETRLKTAKYRFVQNFRERLLFHCVLHWVTNPMKLEQFNGTLGPLILLFIPVLFLCQVKMCADVRFYNLHSERSQNKWERLWLNVSCDKRETVETRHKLYKYSRTGDVSGCDERILSQSTV